MTVKRRRPGRPELFPAEVWAGLTVDQAKVAASVVRGRHFVWLTGGWKFTPAWAAATAADLDISMVAQGSDWMFTHDQTTGELIVPGEEWAETGAVYSGNNKVIRSFASPQIQAGDPGVNVLIYTGKLAKQTLDGHRFMINNLEAMGFQHRRHRLAYLSRIASEVTQ